MRVVLALLLVLPLAAAQVSHDDPAGDVMLQPAGQKAAADDVDILRVWVGDETESHVRLGVDLAAGAAPSVPPFAPYWLNISFARDEARYTINNLGSGYPCMSPWNLYRISDGRLRCVVALEPEDDGQGHIALTIAKTDLKDQNQVPLRAGDQLTDLHIVALRGNNVDGLPAEVTYGFTDRAPDTGGLVFEATEGNASTGDLVLQAARPVRLSNGEATTLVFDVSVVNTGTIDDVILLEARNVPPGWSVRVPARIEVAAGERSRFPVILSMPFQHDHGLTMFFQVMGTSATRAGHYSVLDLGVHWLEEPHLSGHHPSLWFHSAQFTSMFGSGRYGWISALEDDELADDEPLPARDREGPPSENAYSFQMYLRPRLLLGLAFDQSQQGLLEATIELPTPTLWAEVDVRMRYSCGRWPPTPDQPEECRSPIVIARNGTGRIDDPGSQIEIQMPLDIEADLLKAYEWAFVALTIDLTTGLPQASSVPYIDSSLPRPQLAVAESRITLPMIEYHDPVDQLYEDLTSLRISALGAFEKGVNPGRTAMYAFSVRNDADEKQQVHIQLEGTELAWATISADGFTLAPGESRNVTVAVRPPETARPDQRAEIFLVAENAQNPQIMALGRLRAVVIDPAVQDIPDEAGGRAPAKGSPLPAAIALGALALALARKVR